jgi:dihydrofolate synthase/folylpolyglutamate synthase
LLTRQQDPVGALFSLEQFGIKLGLDNIRILCAALADPQQAFRSIIIAGTNGKGSTAAMIDTALRAAGYRVGRYTSPHLVRLEERFSIDGLAISEGMLRQEAEDVMQTIDRLIDAGRLVAPPTFFEATTAVALSSFRRAGVDLAVLEVGLGGRFDATNVVPAVAGAITSIDLDHEPHLGSTIDAIAFEKAGIIKPGMLVVSSEAKRQARDVIARASRERGAHLVLAQHSSAASVEIGDGLTTLTLKTPVRSYGPTTLALRGRHQVSNALTAVRLLEELSAVGIDVPERAIRAGLTDVRWRGRLELLRAPGDLQVLLDAAHNPAGLTTFAAYVREVFPPGLPVVFAAMQDKDVDGMLAALRPAATRVICTQPGTPRAVPARDLAERARRHASETPVEHDPSPLAALQRAWQTGPLVGAVGSIYLIGEIIAGLEHGNAASL